MATKSQVSKSIARLRVGGCYNPLLDDPQAHAILVGDWLKAFRDLEDVMLEDAVRAHLEGVNGRKWPTIGDLLDLAKGLRVARLFSPNGCEECDHTGFRQLLKIDHSKGERARYAAPCDCPKGARISGALVPADWKGPKWKPPEPFYVVAEAWKRQGFEVHVSSADMPAFPHEMLDPSEATRERLGKAREHTQELEAMVAKLVDRWRMEP